MTTREDLQRRDEHRLKLLRIVFEEANGSGGRPINVGRIDHGIPQDELKAAAIYLHSEGLVYLSWPPDGGLVLSLLNPGIDKVESALRNQNGRTEHFEHSGTTIVNRYFENATIGSVQIGGTRNTANVTQSPTPKK